MRLLEIDDSNRGDHTRLNGNDKCYHLWEYTSGQNYKASAVNDLISNFKKKPTASPAVLRHKDRAIQSCATDLQSSLNSGWLSSATIVPVPGSKDQEHPDYDDRLVRLARLLGAHVDVRQLVRQTGSYTAAHEAGADRVTVEDLVSRYVIDERLAEPEPRSIGILDDVLTAGTHYRAMHTVIEARFPHANIVGIFLARRVFPNPFANVDI